MFSFFHEIERPRVIKPCPRCFAELVLLGADPEELESWKSDLMRTKLLVSYMRTIMFILFCL